MKLTARLILMISIVITVTDVIEYIHLRQHPENLGIPLLIGVIFVTILPIAVIILYWHKRRIL